MPAFRQRLDHLCEKANWSYDDVSNFFDVSRTTVYSWQKGRTAPPREVRAIVDVVSREVCRRRRRLTKHEFETWADELVEDGVRAYVNRIATPKGEDRALRLLLARAQRERGLVLETAREKPLAMVVPLTAEALDTFTKLLIGPAGPRNDATEEKERVLTPDVER